MKTNKIIMILLVFILGSSFTGTSYLKKEVLVKGDIITQGKWSPNGYLQFYLRHSKGKIKSLTLKGGVLFLSVKKTIHLKDLNKDKRTPITLRKSLDEMFLLEIDQDFGENGGIIYSSITDNSGKTDYYLVNIVKENNSFVTFRTKIEDSISFEQKYFNELNIELDKEKNILNYKVLPE